MAFGDLRVKSEVEGMLAHVRKKRDALSGKVLPVGRSKAWVDDERRCLDTQMGVLKWVMGISEWSW